MSPILPIGAYSCSSVLNRDCGCKPILTDGGEQQVQPDQHQVCAQPCPQPAPAPAQPLGTAAHATAVGMAMAGGVARGHQATARCRGGAGERSDAVVMR